MKWLCFFIGHNLEVKQNPGRTYVDRRGFVRSGYYTNFVCKRCHWQNDYTEMTLGMMVSDTIWQIRKRISKLFERKREDDGLPF